jgi:competence protein ComEA
MFNLTRGEELTALIAVSLVGLAVAVACLVRGDRGTTEEIPLNKSDETAVQQSRRVAEPKLPSAASTQTRSSAVSQPPVGSSVAAAGGPAQPKTDFSTGARIPSGRFVGGEGVVNPGTRVSPQRAGAASSPTGTAKINVNVADQKELESLPGIGPTLATRIIEFREKQKFQKVDDLIAVRGIGPKTLEKIRDLVCVK